MHHATVLATRARYTRLSASSIGTISPLPFNFCEIQELRHQNARCEKQLSQYEKFSMEDQDEIKKMKEGFRQSKRIQLTTSTGLHVDPDVQIIQTISYSLNKFFFPDSCYLVNTGKASQPLRRHPSTLTRIPPTLHWRSCSTVTPPHVLTGAHQAGLEQLVAAQR